MSNIFEIEWLEHQWKLIQKQIRRATTSAQQEFYSNLHIKYLMKIQELLPRN